MCINIGTHLLNLKNSTQLIMISIKCGLMRLSELGL